MADTFYGDLSLISRNNDLAFVIDITLKLYYFLFVSGDLNLPIKQIKIFHI